jgi:shikimate dehydrogenase
VTHPHPPPAIGRLVLLGHPVAHSLSPRFQNAALAAARLPLTYEALDVAPDALGDTLRELAARRAAGNVTVPHKAQVAVACDELTPLAAAVGAVNTFWHDADGRLVGDNTDVGGFDAAARTLVDPGARPAAVALVGAGGSAAAVVVAVREWPAARLRVWSRTPERARALAARAPHAATPCARVADALDGATLVVNATPLGLAAGDELPTAIGSLPPGAAVLDLVYAPARTRWVREARAAGHAADDGLAMLVEQGALAFARWFGREPDRAAMWAALAAVTRERAGAT